MICRFCYADFNITYIEHESTEDGVQYCPFCGVWLEDEEDAYEDNIDILVRLQDEDDSEDE